VKGKTTVEKNALIVVFFFFLQAILLNNYDFTFATSVDGVGMKTGATIHTMNGLNIYSQKISKDADPPKADRWWEKQHLRMDGRTLLRKTLFGRLLKRRRGATTAREVLVDARFSIRRRK
jgi:hypothetical protein